MLFMQHLYKIMAENKKCDTVTSDFASDTIKCKICQKLVHFHVLKLIYLLILCLMLHIAVILIIAKMHMLSCTLMMIN